MKRRDLFRLGAQKTAQAVLEIAGAMAAARAKNWIRPPYALEELDFLLACTRCDKCIEACPHDVLFTLPARRRNGKPVVIWLKIVIEWSPKLHAQEVASGLAGGLDGKIWAVGKAKRCPGRHEGASCAKRNAK